MLSRADYKDYLRQILEVEVKMQKAYAACIEVMEDEADKAVCRKLSADEVRHASMVREMAHLLGV